MSDNIGRAAGEYRSPRFTGTREATQTRQTIAAGEYRPVDYAAF
jgi:hypothetical protein